MLRTLACALAPVQQACVASRGRNRYRFASPMIGGADVPPARLGSERPIRPQRPDLAVRWSDARTTDIRSIRTRRTRMFGGRRRARRCRPKIGRTCLSAWRPRAPPTTSAATRTCEAWSWSRLPAPHPRAAGCTACRRSTSPPTCFRALVGRRDKGDATLAVIAWSAELGASVALDLTEPAVAPRRRTSSCRRGRRFAFERSPLLASAARLIARAPTSATGSLLVFDRTESERLARRSRRDRDRPRCARRDRVHLPCRRRRRCRRGFVGSAASRRASRRDANGAVVNTFMRAGKRWPPKGTHYLAGELLAHVIRPRRD